MTEPTRITRARELVRLYDDPRGDDEVTRLKNRRPKGAMRRRRQRQRRTAGFRAALGMAVTLSYAAVSSRARDDLLRAVPLTEGDMFK